VPGSREQVLTVLGKALASVGHELNNIAGVVQNYAAFIEEATKDQGILADAQVIRGCAEKASLVARQLLAFGHPREQEAEALELGALLLDVHGFLKRGFGEECQIEVQHGTKPVVVLARRALLGRLLLDLVLAARAMLASGSSLRLGASTIEHSGVRFAELWLREQRAHGAEPSGVGVGASGLDLPSIRESLAEQGGELHSSFDTARGLSVSLVLPSPSGLDTPSEQAGAGDRVEARGNETVLIVEENAELRTAICRMLEAAGYRALEAEDDGIARSLGLEGGVPVDLVLTSSTNNESLGRALGVELRSVHPYLSVLHQVKPFSSAELQGAVRAALDDRARLSEKVPTDAARVLALVVDDDAHVRLALSRILIDVGADVVTAPSGLHALQKLQELPVDLVIADQLMPGMEGTRLLETAYKTWPHVMRVVYTGYLSSGLVVDAVNRASVHKVLAKDMAPEWLRQQLAECVAEIRAARPV
jgi:CheY-like chemotaxis protein